MRRMFDAWSEIEDFRLEVELCGHAPGDEVELDRRHRARCFRSVHRVPSLSWLVERTTHRLRPEFAGKAAQELKALRNAGVEITQPHSCGELAVTGDTQIELWSAQPELRRARVLVYEVTSWDERRDVSQTRQWGHTHVDEMIEVAEMFEGDALVLVHRSPRHTKREAEAIVRQRFPSAVLDRVHVFGS
jgi:ribonuclease Z